MPNPNLMAKGERKGGRKKGTRNKVTPLLKEAILQTGQQAGNDLNGGGLVGYLQYQAEANPVAFMTLLGRVLPLQAKAMDGKPLIHAKIELVAKSPEPAGSPPIRFKEAPAPRGRLKTGT